MILIIEQAARLLPTASNRWLLNAARNVLIRRDIYLRLDPDYRIRADWLKK